MRTRRATEICRSIAANLRRTRLIRGWTQEELGELAGVAPRYVQRIETGRMNPSAVVVASLAEALNIDPGRLFRPAQLEARPEGRPKAYSAPQSVLQAAEKRRSFGKKK